MSLIIKNTRKIFDISENWGREFGFSHCHKPTPFLLNKETLRVYYGLRDKNNRTKISFVDIDTELMKIKYVHRDIVLDLGALGTFDDAGVQVCSVVRVSDNEVYMYYFGWNTSTTVPSRNALGLAISYDNGTTFKRLYEGPILERYKDEPYYVGASDIKYEDGCWRMWYDSGKGFKVVDGRAEYLVHIKYAESNNGIDWIKKNVVCIEPNENEAVVRPSVIKINGKYIMFYSYRDIDGFRVDKNKTYKFGYAESSDGIFWIRKDQNLQIKDLPQEDSWDSQMRAYPYVLRINDMYYILYNGNGFGKTGFGIAEIEYGE